MNHSTDNRHRSILKMIARNVMIERGFLPDFPPEALAELTRLRQPIFRSGDGVRDLRNIVWCSIDNDDSNDLDQLTVAEAGTNGKVRIRVAVADVDAVVAHRSEIDDHAQHNTASIYTAAQIFPMLPEKLSTDMTSLNLDDDRLAIVIDMQVAPDGSVGETDIYSAWVRNKAKLTYHSIAKWLESESEVPANVSAINGLEASIRLQDNTALLMRDLRHLHGALNLETIQARPLFDDDQILDLIPDEKNRAKGIIEDYMIAANGAVVRFLSAAHFPTLRRVVRTPKRWARIVELAKSHGTTLPAEPNSVALDKFLVSARKADPISFPDLSLSVIKLLGAGEYVAEPPGQSGPGHFGLAMSDYSHATAPNRRYPDLITQRLLKAAIARTAIPYQFSELESLATHCTSKENDARKVERQVEKSAAAMLLESRVGEHFDAIVTGASEKGVWVRLFRPLVEGRLTEGFERLDVGDQLRVRLLRTDVERGFIDFIKI